MLLGGNGDSVDDDVVLSVFLKAKGYFQIVCPENGFYFICFCFKAFFIFRDTCWFTPVPEKIDCIYKYIYHSSLFVSVAFDIINVHMI